MIWGSGVKNGASGAKIVGSRVKIGGSGSRIGAFGTKIRDSVAKINWLLWSIFAPPGPRLGVCSQD